MTAVKEKILDKSTELIEKVYDDGAKDFVHESGITVSLIPKAINAALVPMRKWIAEREYSLKETQILLEKKLKNISADEIVAPESYIAVPALQAISYSMDNEILRNLYANLLANSMNIKVKDSVHPSFVDIIKQMSPSDAQIFGEICVSEIRPTIDLSISINNEIGEKKHLYNITWINTYDYAEVLVSLSNLQRIGLIQIDKGIEYTHDPNYEIVRKNIVYLNYKKKYERMTNVKINENKQFIKITPLGDLFYRICVKD